MVRRFVVWGEYACEVHVGFVTHQTLGLERLRVKQPLYDGANRLPP